MIQSTVTATAQVSEIRGGKAFGRFRHWRDIRGGAEIARSESGEPMGPEATGSDRHDIEFSHIGFSIKKAARRRLLITHREVRI